LTSCGGWDFGVFEEDGTWTVLTKDPTDSQANPWPKGSIVRVSSFSVRLGMVRGNAWADEYAFRVQYRDGSWAPKAASWALETAPGWGWWNFLLRGFRRVPNYLREMGVR
jgi:hypothetical protein